MISVNLGLGECHGGVAVVLRGELEVAGAASAAAVVRRVRPVVTRSLPVWRAWSSSAAAAWGCCNVSGCSRLAAALTAGCPILIAVT